jgi:uncharacterized protein YsxB (DUF464 family)
MILIKLRENSLEIKGHAMYARPGEDIVCSAVSALGLTAAECMLREEQEGNLKVVSCDIGSGTLSLKWQGKAQFINTIGVGLELIEKNYKEYVKAV